MQSRIAVLPGYVIGTEVMVQALRVLDRIGDTFNHSFLIQHALVGGAAYEEYGTHFPEETLKICSDSDAILFGSVGGPVSDMDLPKWKNCEANSIIALRKAFQFSVNFRPVKVLSELASMSPLKPELIAGGIDILFVRELLGDIYFGEHKLSQQEGFRFASDIAQYSEMQIASVAKSAFEAARLRSSKVTSVDKANVLSISKLWREVVREVHRDYQDVELEDMLVDNCAMQLVIHPKRFDVILCSNMFGDILSDIGAVLPGSLGLLASASINTNGFGLFEPPGGSAQDIAGKGLANPIAQILSVAMMLRFSFSLEHEARVIEQAVEKVLKSGKRTRDILGIDGLNPLTTEEMTDAILMEMRI